MPFSREVCEEVPKSQAIARALPIVALYQKGRVLDTRTTVVPSPLAEKGRQVKLKQILKPQEVSIKKTKAQLSRSLSFIYSFI